MADRVSASIVIGGSLSAAAFATLADLVAYERLSVEWDGPPFDPSHKVAGEPLRLYAHEVAGGQFEDLESWCVEQALPFTRWSGGYPGAWLPERIVFVGTGEARSFDVDEDDHVVVHRSTVEQLASIEALRSWFDAADFVVPPLQVEAPVGDASREIAGQEERGEEDGEHRSQSRKGQPT